MEIFLDTEFTGLHQNTTLISIGLVAMDGREFYGEFNDYDQNQVDDWIKDNVISNLSYPSEDEGEYYSKIRFDPTLSELEKSDVKMRSDTGMIRRGLGIWLKEFPSVEIWSDCLVYDWVLFNNIWGDAFNIPSNVYYIPFDICTLFKLKGIDPNISREKFIDLEDSSLKHNASYDAKVIKQCYLKLMDRVWSNRSLK